jgi:hypothetical protein
MINHSSDYGRMMEAGKTLDLRIHTLASFLALVWPVSRGSISTVDIVGCAGKYASSPAFHKKISLQAQLSDLRLEAFERALPPFLGAQGLRSSGPLHAPRIKCEFAE